VFHGLFEVSAVDKNYSGDFDIFRFHLPERVQAPIVIALHVVVMVTRLPTALGGRDRQAHDLTGVQDACMILRCVQPATLSEERGGGREHDQEDFYQRFSPDFHF